MALLDAWLPARRWYPVKGVAVTHVPWLSFVLEVPASAAAPGRPDAAWPGTRVELHLLRLVGDGVDLVVQVPLVLEPATSPVGLTPGGAAPIGTLAPRGADDAGWVVHDGAAHPACWAALLAVAEWESHGTAPDGASPGGARPEVDA